MAIPVGTDTFARIIARKSRSKTLSNFMYQVDLSPVLEVSAEFKSYISTAANIAVYDYDNDTELYRTVFLDLANDKLVVYFTANSSDTVNRIFYICVGSAISRSNYTDYRSPANTAGYEIFMPLKEFSSSMKTYEMTELSEHTIVGNISFVDGQFGRCAYNPGTSNGAVDAFTRMDSGDLSIEMLVYAVSGGFSTFGRVFGTRSGLQMFISGSNFRFTNDSDTRVSIPAVGAWHHLLINRGSAGGVHCYVDGNDALPGGPFAGTPTGTAWTDYLMNDAYSQNNPMNGYQSDFGLYYGLRSTNFAIMRANMLKYPSTFWILPVKVRDLMPVF